MLKYYLTIIIILLKIFVVHSQNSIDFPDTEKIKWEEKIYNDFKKFGIAKRQAEKIMYSVIDTFSVVESYLGDIASKYIPDQERKSLKTKVLEHFVSSKSKIQVKSLYRKTPRRYNISDYLDRLMDLAYYKVTLYFGNDYEVSKLKRNKPYKYEIPISVWQYFIARNEEGSLIYSNKTLKTFFFRIDQLKYNWGIKINEIHAKEIKQFPIITTEKENK